MIRRNYFFVASCADEQSESKTNGMVTLRSWLPDPRLAMDRALDRVCLDYRWPRELVLIERFNCC